MNNKPRSPRRDAVLKMLQDKGPMSHLKLSREMGIDHAYARLIYSHLLKEEPRRVHIVSYDYEIVRQIRFPRPVIAFGPGEDAPKPKTLHEKRAEARKLRTTKLARQVDIDGLLIPVMNKPRADQPVRIADPARLHAMSSIFNIAKTLRKKD